LVSITPTTDPFRTGIDKPFAAEGMLGDAAPLFLVRFCQRRMHWPIAHTWTTNFSWWPEQKDRQCEV
jgi:hypothetical protein